VRVPSLIRVGLHHLAPSNLVVIHPSTTRFPFCVNTSAPICLCIRSSAAKSEAPAAFAPTPPHVVFLYRHPSETLIAVPPHINLQPLKLSVFLFLARHSLKLKPYYFRLFIGGSGLSSVLSFKVLFPIQFQLHSAIDVFLPLNTCVLTLPCAHHMTCASCMHLADLSGAMLWTSYPGC
jgi:hypothetical protein